MRKNGIIMIAAFAASCFAGGISYTMEKLADTSASFVSKVEYPAFRNYSELNKYIAHKVKDGYASLKKQYSADWKDMDSLRHSDGDTTATSPFAYNVTCDSLSESDRYVSMLFTFYDWTGGAHGNVALWSVTYDKKKKSAASIADVSGFSLKELSGICRRELVKTQCGGNAKDSSCVTWVNEGTAPRAENYSAFTFDGKALTVYFAPYQVAPWSEGTVPVSIPVKKR